MRETNRHWWVMPLFCQISGGSAWFRGYRVHGFEATGYLALRVRAHSFEGTGNGYIVAHYPSQTSQAQGTILRQDTIAYSIL